MRTSDTFPFILRVEPQDIPSFRDALMYAYGICDALKSNSLVTVTDDRDLALAAEALGQLIDLVDSA